MIALYIFVVDYGLLFWAERRVPSGIAAVMLATIPVFMTLSEIIFLRTQRLTVRLALALLVGIGGVLILVSHSVGLSEKPINPAGAVALVIAAMSWSVASTLARKLSLPESKVMSSGAQMLAGGIMLAGAAALLGEFRGFHIQEISRGAWFALAYLIVAGSIIGIYSVCQEVRFKGWDECCWKSLELGIQARSFTLRSRIRVGIPPGNGTRITTEPDGF
jgi:drug/metabolite transporter (DMT)-like permease